MKYGELSDDGGMWNMCSCSRLKTIGYISATEVNSVGVLKLPADPPVLLGPVVTSVDGVPGAREPSRADSVMLVPYRFCCYQAKETGYPDWISANDQST